MRGTAGERQSPDQPTPCPPGPDLNSKTRRAEAVDILSAALLALLIRWNIESHVIIDPSCVPNAPPTSLPSCHASKLCANPIS